MNKELFSLKIKEIEDTFAPEIFAPAMTKFLFSSFCKISDDNWIKVVSAVIGSFVPFNKCLLPVPKHFHDALLIIHREDERKWKYEKMPDEAVDLEGLLVYRAEISKLMKKLTGNGDFKLRTSHIDGVFACEICHRNGCNGGTEQKLKNGCNAFLSEEKEKELKELREFSK